MKRFDQRQLLAAYAHAKSGGQALHVCDVAPFITKRTPGCFRRSAQFAHLFDQNLCRLKATARHLGVRVLKVERVGEIGQHIDLCGQPLARAIKQSVAGTPTPIPSPHEMPLALSFSE